MPTIRTGKLVDNASSASGTNTRAGFSEATSYTLTVNVTSPSTGGAAAIRVKPRGSSAFMPLTTNGVQVSLPLTGDSTFGPFDGPIAEFESVHSGFNGASFDIVVTGW